MCVGSIQIQAMLHKGLQHPWLLVFTEILGPIPLGYQGRLPFGNSRMEETPKAGYVGKTHRASMPCSGATTSQHVVVFPTWKLLESLSFGAFMEALLHRHNQWRPWPLVTELNLQPLFYRWWFLVVWGVGVQAESSNCNSSQHPQPPPCAATSPHPVEACRSPSHYCKVRCGWNRLRMNTGNTVEELRVGPVVRRPALSLRRSNVWWGTETPQVPQGGQEPKSSNETPDAVHLYALELPSKSCP